MNASPSPFSAHSDVLDATVPDDAPGKERLLAELKNRGKGAVTAGSWPDAQALYKKALECCSDDSDAQKAILYSNLSLVQGKMNYWSEARESAQKAVDVDPTYTKGFWRLGQAYAALKGFGLSVDALEEAAKLEPSNKALQKELSKQKENAQKAAEAAAEAEAAARAEKEASQDSAASTTSSEITTSKSKTTKSSRSKTSNEAEPMQVDEDEAFTKSEHVKGYKIVNGKKTSYFHNELSEEAKRLIGDIAPKKLEEAAPDSSSTADNNGTSAWNKAGTWEERDVTAWAKDSIQAQLEQATYTLPASSPAPGGMVKTEKVKVSGHASVAMVRGKKRYIYELSIELEWSFSHEGNDANGKLSFPDVDGTCMVGEPYEATSFSIEHSDQSQLQPLLENFVHKQGWREKVHEAIDNWVGLFKETY